MERTEENIKRVTPAIRKLSCLPGYPTDQLPPEAMMGYTEAFLRIVHGKTLGEMWKLTWRKHGKEPEGPFPGFPEDMMDYDWLVAKALNTCQRFPTPTQLRDLYNSRFDPAEGHKEWKSDWDRLYAE